MNEIEKRPLSIKLRGQIILQYCFGGSPDGRGIAVRVPLQVGFLNFCDVAKQRLP